MTGRGQTPRLSTRRASPTASGASTSVRLRRRARGLARRILAADDRVVAVALYGSAAVGEAGEGSDIDLLILARSRVRLADLAELVDLHAPDLNVTVHTPLSLAGVHQRDWSFLACLADQAVLLAGEDAALSWLSRPQPDRATTARQLEGMRHWLFSASLGYEIDEDGVCALHEAYRIARCAVVLANAADGVRAWRRHAALAAAAVASPRLADAIADIAALEPYWRAYHRGEALNLPDPTPDRVTAALDTAGWLIDELTARQGAVAVVA